MATYNLGQAAIVARGAYSSSATYLPLNLVTNNGGSYLAKETVSGVEPGVTSGWANYWVASTVGIKTIARLSNTASTTTYRVTLTDGTHADIAIANNGVTNIEWTSNSAGAAQGTAGTTDTYTIYYGSNSTVTFPVRNGDPSTNQSVVNEITSGGANPINSIAVLSYLGGRKFAISDGTNTGATSSAITANATTTIRLPTTIKATTFSGNLSGNVTGNVTGNVSGSSGSCTGNAATATKLATARKIGNANFDGTAAITLSAMGAAATASANTFSAANTFSGNMTLSGGQLILNSNIFGNSLPSSGKTNGRIFFKKV